MADKENVACLFISQTGLNTLRKPVYSSTRDKQLQQTLKNYMGIPKLDRRDIQPSKIYS